MIAMRFIRSDGHSTLKPQGADNMQTRSRDQPCLSPLGMHCCISVCLPLRVMPGVLAAARLSLATLRHPQYLLAAQLLVEQQEEQQHLPLQSSPAERSTSTRMVNNLCSTGTQRKWPTACIAAVTSFTHEKRCPVVLSACMHAYNCWLRSLTSYCHCCP
jgi:hypothetical protein